MSNVIVGICDDEIVILRQLEKIIGSLLEEKGMAFEIHTFLTAAELIRSASLLEVLFLDIEMPQTDGIEAGKKIREINPRCKIIMATCRVDRFKEAFHIEAFRFITKPFDHDEVEEALNVCLKHKWGSESIKLYRERILYDVNQREVMYIRAFDGYLEFACNHLIFRKECSLKTIYEELDRRLFVKTSRSYIVNMSYISKYENGNITLQSETMKVSRREKKNFEYNWINYDLNYRWGR